MSNMQNHEQTLKICRKWGKKWKLYDLVPCVHLGTSWYLAFFKIKVSKGSLSLTEYFGNPYHLLRVIIFPNCCNKDMPNVQGHYISLAQSTTRPGMGYAPWYSEALPFARSNLSLIKVSKTLNISLSIWKRKKWIHLQWIVTNYCHSMR